MGKPGKSKLGTWVLLFGLVIGAVGVLTWAFLSTWQGRGKQVYTRDTVEILRNERQTLEKMYDESRRNQKERGISDAEAEAEVARFKSEMDRLDEEIRQAESQKTRRKGEPPKD